MDINTIFTGDALDWLRTLPDNSVDSLVTDPPSGMEFMGKQWDSNKGGRDQWIAWLTDIMREACRVLKPGAHGLVWAIPRTSHWTMTALEDAGFEIRNVMHFIFGTGFPKSLDVGKAIDKYLGVTRSIMGYKYQGYPNGSIDGIYGDYTATKEGVPVSLPATPEAQAHDGEWTDLKPAVEYWIMVRKPFPKGYSVARNVLTWGTGGLRIDDTRIALTQGEQDTTRPKGQSQNAYNYSQHEEKLLGEPTGGHPKGRFPTHLVLGHSPLCVARGTKQVRGNAPFSRTDETTLNAYGTYSTQSSVTHGEIEEVVDWDCHESCPVRLLDEQSGVRTSGYMKPAPQRKKQQRRQGNIYNARPLATTEYGTYADRGGASRYFMQVQPTEDDIYPALFYYGSKASTKERNAGCDALPYLTAGETTERVDGSAGLNSPRAGAGRTSGSRNAHPTVKPLALMRYLIRLITPHGGVVLDCFAGSGSTCMAALLEGCAFLACEKEEMYVRVAEARIAYTMKGILHEVTSEQ